MPIFGSKISVLEKALLQNQNGASLLSTLKQPRMILLIKSSLINYFAIIAGPKGADSDAIQITDPDNGKLYTRLGWYNTHDKTDGLGMIAGTRFIRDIRGPGVLFWREIKC